MGAERVPPQVRGADPLPELGAVLLVHRERLAERAEALAGFLRQAGEELRERRQPEEASCADWACRQAGRVSEFLRSGDPEDLGATARGLARHPSLLLAGAAAALGFGLARLLGPSSGGGEEP